MFPTETFEQISQHLERSDLLSLCQVSLFYRDQANRILYRTVFTGRSGIAGKEYLKLAQFIRTIRTSPHLALHVREFKFVAPSKVKDLMSGPSAKAVFSSFIRSSFAAQKSSTRPFSSLVNIRKLTIESFEPHLPWPEYLNCFPSGNLTDLTTYFTIGPAFLEFLAQHQSVQTLNFPFLTIVNSKDNLTLPANLVPSMMRLMGNCLILPLVESWCGLTHLQLGCGPTTDPGPLLSALATIGPRLVNLMISGHDGAQWKDSEVLKFPAIAERTPNLEIFSFRAYHLESVRFLLMAQKRFSSSINRITWVLTLSTSPHRIGRSLIH
jgi:hypothetical protein